MATSKTGKTTTAAKPSEQTTLPVTPEVKAPVAEVKTDTKKETASEPVVKKVEEKKTETKAAEPAKPAARRGRPPKNAAGAKKTRVTKKTATTRTRKTAAKKESAEVSADVFIQLDGNEYSEKSIMEQVVAAWEAEGKKASAIKKAKLYVKPRDGKAYYVINEGLKNGSSGAVDL